MALEVIEGGADRGERQKQEVDQRHQKEQAEALAITEDNLKRLLEVIESMGAVNREVPSKNLAPPK